MHYYLCMKCLLDYISEAKLEYTIREEYLTVANNVCDGLVKKLPAWPNHKDANIQKWDKAGAGKFWWNTGDVVRYKCENSKYIGYKLNLLTTLDLKSNNIDPEKLSAAIEYFFGTTIQEGVFDNNIDKKMPEYEYVSKLYSVLHDFFKTNNFSKVPIRKDDHSDIILNSSDMNLLKSMPSIEKDGFTISLWNINASTKSYDKNLYSIHIGIVIYEEKDPVKIADLKAREAARVAKDCIGRDLAVGDTVAYSPGGINGWDPLPVGVISKVGKDRIEVDGKKAYGYRCCLISRKGGKPIE